MGPRTLCMGPFSILPHRSAACTVWQLRGASHDKSHLKVRQCYTRRHFSKRPRRSTALRSDLAGSAIEHCKGADREWGSRDPWHMGRNNNQFLQRRIFAVESGLSIVVWSRVFAGGTM